MMIAPKTYLMCFDLPLPVMKSAEAIYDIKGNYIFSILRTFPKNNIKNVINAGAHYLNKGVVAFDLAGAELAGFCHEFIPYVNYAIEKGFTSPYTLENKG